jgi:hypothetical protein
MQNLSLLLAGSGELMKRKPYIIWGTHEEKTIPCV